VNVLHACEEIPNIHTYNLLSLEQEDWPLPSEKVRARLQSMFPGMRAWQEVSLEGPAERAAELYCLGMPIRRKEKTPGEQDSLS
jgi:hypothetical protein